jgi:hypothetical protein
VLVYGSAEISGSTSEVRAYPGSHVIIDGIVNKLSGAGSILKKTGSVIAGRVTP